MIPYYEVFDARPRDRELLRPAVEAHEAILGRVPDLAAADAGFYAQAQAQAVQEKGVQGVAVPNGSPRRAERKKMEKSRWCKKAPRWRTGCEGRISVVKRRPGLNRCRYRGVEGMKRWVGLGVLADHLITIGTALARARGGPRECAAPRGGGAGPRNGHSGSADQPSERRDARENTAFGDGK